MLELFFFLPYLIVLAVGMGAILVAIYWRFGSGLAIKIYGIVFPVIDGSVLAGMAADRLEFGSTAHVMISLPIIILDVGGLAYLYRITVRPLSEYSQSLQSSSAQLSATSTQFATTAAEQSSMATQVSPDNSPHSRCLAVDSPAKRFCFLRKYRQYSLSHRKHCDV